MERVPMILTQTWQNRAWKVNQRERQSGYWDVGCCFHHPDIKAQPCQVSGIGITLIILVTACNSIFSCGLTTTIRNKWNWIQYIFFIPFSLNLLSFFNMSLGKLSEYLTLSCWMYGAQYIVYHISIFQYPPGHASSMQPHYAAWFMKDVPQSSWWALTILFNFCFWLIARPMN